MLEQVCSVFSTNSSLGWLWITSTDVAFCLLLVLELLSPRVPNVSESQVSLLHLTCQAGDHRWYLVALVRRIAKFREHNRVQRLVKVESIHGLALRGLGSGFSVFKRNDGLAQFADLTNRREVCEAGGMDDGIDDGIFLIGERVHKVRERFDVHAFVVKKDLGKCRINTSEINSGTPILAIAIRTVLTETTAREFERKQKATGNIMINQYHVHLSHSLF